jgi:hypothetical protein
MRTTVLLAAFLFSCLALARDARADDKDRLPASATWELRSFNVLFRVVRTDYDADKKQVRWRLETKEGARTADFVRTIDREQPFTFTFLDEDDGEQGVVQLRAADFRGIPRDRVMKEGTRLEVTLDLPRNFAKVKKVVLRRGRG